MVGSDTEGCYRETTYGLSEGAISDNFFMTLKVLYDYLIVDEKIISLPTAEEARGEALLFCQKSGFLAPLLWGALDGFHVKVRPAKKRQNDKSDPRTHFWNRSS